MKSDSGSRIRKFAFLGVIVGDLVGYTLTGVGLGYLAMTRWGAPWWVLLISSMAGLALAFYRIYRIAEKAEKER